LIKPFKKAAIILQDRSFNIGFNLGIFRRWGTILGFHCRQAVIEDYDEEHVLVVDSIRFRESELPTNDKPISHNRWDA
jgi:hypothetical protein